MDEHLVVACERGHAWMIDLPASPGGTDACPHAAQDPQVTYLCGECGKSVIVVKSSGPVVCLVCGGPTRCAKCAAGAIPGPVLDPRCPVCHGGPIRTWSHPPVVIRTDWGPETILR